MIANITHTSQSKPLINYNENKVEKGEAERIYFNGIDEFSDRNRVISEFSFATKASKRKDNYVHISLNFTSEDFEKLDQEKVIEIANFYLKELGFPDEQLKIIYRHFDTKHPHIHIVIPKIVNGKALTETTNFKKSMMITRKIEKEFGLSITEKGKQSKEDYSIQTVNDFIQNENPSKTEKIKAFNSFFKFFHQQHKPINFEEYKEQLKKFGIEVIQNIDKTDQNKVLGLLYKRFDVDEIPIKSSLLYNSIPLKRQEKYFQNNTKNRDYRYSQIIKKFENINKKYDFISYDDIKKEFDAINIDVQFVSKGDVINAYRFYDKEQNIHYKPSAIDRKISFGNLKNKIKNTSERNKNNKNNSILFLLEKEYKNLIKNGEIKEDNSDGFINFMVENGMKPVVRKNQIQFSHISVKNPEDKDYSRPVSINVDSVDFVKVSKIINHPNYNKYIYEKFKRKNTKEEESFKRTGSKSKDSNFSLLRLFDLIFDVGSVAMTGKKPKLKIYKKVKF